MRNIKLTESDCIFIHAVLIMYAEYDLIEKMIAFGNNNEIAKADSLYTILQKEYKLNDLHMEHILYHYNSVSYYNDLVKQGEIREVAAKFKK